jgi:NTE family protein
MSLLRIIAVLLPAVLASGCATVINNDPVNAPLTAGEAKALAEANSRTDPALDDDVVVALAFSGGGTRAAAFSFGALTEMAQAQVTIEGQTVPLLDRLDFVSGVSGGSVTAAYYGLRKRAALDDFRQKFLLRDAEESLNTSLSIANISRAFAGGVNDSTNLPRWLNANLFHGATLGEYRDTRRPRIWINAADIYNRTPFVFGRTAFTAACSDLLSYPIADAVAASAAVPIVFAPVVIKTYPERCTDKLPEWITRSRDNPRSPPMLKSFAEAMTRYRSGAMPYIKLLDGGLVDNFGLSGFTIARLSSETPYGPLSQREAVKLRRVLFVVVDAGRGPAGDWVQTVQGPDGAALVMAAADTAIDASVRAGFTAFEATMADWENALIRWRCGLPAAARTRLGAPANWNCRNLKFRVSRVGFDQFDQARAAQLNAVPTRFKLPPEQVDMVIAAGAEALRNDSAYRAFLSDLGGRTSRGRQAAARR